MQIIDVGTISSFMCGQPWQVSLFKDHLAFDFAIVCCSRSNDLSGLFTIFTDHQKKNIIVIRRRGPNPNKGGRLFWRDSEILSDVRIVHGVCIPRVCQ